MKLNRWLEDAQSRPGRTLIINTVVYAVAQTISWAALAYAISTRRIDVWIAFCVNAFLPPFFIWGTLNSVRRAWRNEPRNDLDESIPAVILMAACFVLWLVVRHY